MPSDYIASITSVDVGNQLLVALRKHLEATNGEPNPLITSAFCGMLHHLDGNQFKSLVAFLLKDLENGPIPGLASLASKVYSFHLMFIAAKGEEQRAEVAETTQSVLLLALNLFYPVPLNTSAPKKAWHSQVKVASDFIADVVGKKYILVLTGHEVSIIISRMNSLVPPISHARHCTRMKEFSVYCCVCKVLTSLFKHYPKQLYGCAPSVISVMRSLILHVIAIGTNKGAGEMAEGDTSSKAQEYEKLCELLAAHKDIFKKHAVGLILDFVEATEVGMNSETKRNLMPSIYLLLDMCSQYEMEQLNTSMSSTGRALFSSVHQSYQKVHKYKGQY